MKLEMRRFLMQWALTGGMVFAALYALIDYRPLETTYLTELDRKVRCPIEIAGAGPSVGPGGAWEISGSGRPELSPVVQIDEMGWSRPSCRLEVVKRPTPPFMGVDWRIGYAAPVIEPFRGETVTVTMRVQADRPLRLPAGSAYSYDGRTVSGQSIRQLDEEMRTVTWTHLVAPDATSLEVWLRLTLHDDIEGRGVIWLHSTRVRVES